ncbi:MAG: hypothetical protein H7A23_06015 [Leptospiraceae bacterium]|nr:hypothetical protein [Leptospiraceae bacterium]
MRIIAFLPMFLSFFLFSNSVFSEKEPATEVETKILYHQYLPTNLPEELILTGRVIPKPWVKNLKWDSLGMDYYVLKVDKNPHKIPLSKGCIILRPSENVHYLTLKDFLDKDVVVKGIYKKAVPYVDKGEWTEMSTDLNTISLAENSGFIVYDIKLK